MDTIAVMTGDVEADAAPGGAAAADPQAAPRSDSARADRERRSVMVPMLSTVVAALIAGVFALAVIGFNTLRDDFNSLRDDFNSVREDIHDVRDDIPDVRDDIEALDAKVDTRISDLRDNLDARFARVDDRFEQVNAILLDHAERLSRIEAVLDVHPENHVGS